MLPEEDKKESSEHTRAANKAATAVAAASVNASVATSSSASNVNPNQQSQQQQQFCCQQNHPPGPCPSETPTYTEIQVKQEPCTMTHCPTTGAPIMMEGVPSRYSVSSFFIFNVGVF